MAQRDQINQRRTSGRDAGSVLGRVFAPNDSLVTCATFPDQQKERTPAFSERAPLVRRVIRRPSTYYDRRPTRLQLNADVEGSRHAERFPTRSSVYCPPRPAPAARPRVGDPPTPSGVGLCPPLRAFVPTYCGNDHLLPLLHTCRVIPTAARPSSISRSSWNPAWLRSTPTDQLL